MAGLREMWGLGDPPAPPPPASPAVEQQREAFTRALGRINAALRFTVADAPGARQDPLAKRRDELCVQYQAAIGRGAGEAAELQGVVLQAESLSQEAGRLAELSRDAKRRWERRGPQLEASEEALAHAGGQGGQGAATLQTRLSGALEAARRREYEAACELLDDAANAARDLPPAASERRYQLKGALDQTPVVPSDPGSLASWQNPLVEGDPRDLFTPERMDAVVDMHFTGEGSPQLNTAMKAVLFAQPGEDISAHVAEIGRLRGLGPATVEQQFARFQQIQGVAKQLEAARGLPPDEAVTARRDEYLQTHGDFLGSRSSLRFGQVVGEALGLDPALAAMLNPTGGMVGPGMDVLAPTGADSPIIWHGIFHDAGGYLLNYQNSGPGYSYVEGQQPESGRRGADPLQGQVEGVSYWYERRQPDNSVFEDLYEPDWSAEDPKGKQLAYDRFVKHPIADAEAVAHELTGDAVNEVRELTGDARRVNQESSERLSNATRTAAAAVRDSVDRANESVDAMAVTARSLGVDSELVATSERAIRGELQAASRQVQAWEAEVTAKLRAASGAVDEDLRGLQRWADDARGAVWEKTAHLGEGAVHGALLAVAQSSDLQDGLRRGANFYGETKQDVESLIATAGSQLDTARAQANAFYERAAASIDANRDLLAAAKDSLVSRLAAAEAEVTESVNQLRDRIDRAERLLNQSGQNIRDAACGVADPTSDAVPRGTDAVANAIGSATSAAAERLDSLTNLLG